MARLAGINIPDNKHAEVSLTYIYGIGRKTAPKSVRYQWRKPFHEDAGFE